MKRKSVEQVKLRNGFPPETCGNDRLLENSASQEICGNDRLLENGSLQEACGIDKLFQASVFLPEPRATNHEPRATSREPQTPFAGDSIRITITARSNQRCACCPVGGAEGEAAFDPSEILSRIEGLDAGVRRVVFTGGEPTIVKKLPSFVSAARARGAPEIEVETNGMAFSYEKYAAGLRRAGLTAVTVSFHHFSAAESDSLTGTPGGFELAMKGLRNCAREGMSARARFILTPQLLRDRGGLGDFLGRLRREGALPLEAACPAPPPFPDLTAMEVAVGAIAAWAFSENVSFRFAPERGLPPCLFAAPEAAADVFHLEPGAAVPGMSRTPECGGCVLASLCPGMPEKCAGDFRRAARPLTSADRLAAFRVRSKDEAKSLANFCSFLMLEGVDGRPVMAEALLRVNYHCNQRCRFCWIGPDFHNLPRETIEGKIAELGARGLKVLAITGGEPTLNPQLEEYIRLAAGLNIREITLQTNAVLIAKEGFAARLKNAGLSAAFVSLHGHTAEVSDAVTGAPGTFEKTVEGITRLLEEKIYVTLSLVVNTLNAPGIRDYVRFVAGRFPGVPINFSVVAPMYGTLMHRGIVPRLKEIKAPLLGGVELCLELGVPFAGLASFCGIPPCALDGDARCFPDLQRVVPQGGDFDMIKTPGCKSCTFDAYCYGLRRYYAEIYGSDEIRPLSVPPPEIKTNLSCVSVAEFFQKMVAGKKTGV